MAGNRMAGNRVTGSRTAGSLTPGKETAGRSLAWPFASKETCQGSDFSSVIVSGSSLSVLGHVTSALFGFGGMAELSTFLSPYRHFLFCLPRLFTLS